MYRDEYASDFHPGHSWERDWLLVSGLFDPVALVKISRVGMEPAFSRWKRDTLPIC